MPSSTREKSNTGLAALVRAEVRKYSDYGNVDDLHRAGHDPSVSFARTSLDPDSERRLRRFVSELQAKYGIF
jgi:hypothetical protein